MLSFPYPFFLVEILLPLPVGTQMAKTMLSSPLNLSIGIKLSNERFSAPRKSRTFSCYVHARLPLLFSDCWHCLTIEEVDNVHKRQSAISRPQGFSLKKKWEGKGKIPLGTRLSNFQPKWSIANSSFLGESATIIFLLSIKVSLFSPFKSKFALQVRLFQIGRDTNFWKFAGDATYKTQKSKTNLHSIHSNTRTSKGRV